MIEKLFQSKQVFESKKWWMMFFSGIQEPILKCQENEMFASNGMCKEAVVFSGVCLWFGVDRQSQRGSRV